MYNKDSKEDVEYRLLHVYYSAKRAQNIKPSTMASPPKRSKRPPLPVLSSSTHQPYQNLSSMVTASVDKSLSPCNSPLSLDHFLSPSPARSIHYTPSVENSNFITPVNLMYSQGRVSQQFAEYTTPTSSPFRFRNEHSPGLTRVHENSFLHSPFQRARLNDDIETEFVSFDPFQYDIEQSLYEADSVFNDPYSPQTTMNLTGNRTSHKSHVLVERLESLRESIRELVMTAPTVDQAPLVNVVTNWARHVAKDPLGDYVSLDQAPLEVSQADCIEHGLSSPYSPTFV
jgi:hypothetical protein